MTNPATPVDFHILDLPEDATPEEARRAYHRKKALYAEGALATYTLIETDERKEILDRIERAYMRISRDLRDTSPECYPPPVQPAETEQPITPEAGDGIGPFLRKRRESMGVTLKDIADKTRIRATYLGQIEAEDYQNLPAPVYLRGFVLEFARVLEIPDPKNISEMFLAQMRSAGK